MKRFDRIQMLDDRQLRSLARFDQRRAELRRVDALPRRDVGRLFGQFTVSGIFELEQPSTTSHCPVVEYLFENRGALWSPRYWWQITSRWRSRFADVERRQYL